MATIYIRKEGWSFVSSLGLWSIVWFSLKMSCLQSRILCWEHLVPSESCDSGGQDKTTGQGMLEEIIWMKDWTFLQCGPVMKTTSLGPAGQRGHNTAVWAWEESLCRDGWLQVFQASDYRSWYPQPDQNCITDCSRLAGGILTTAFSVEKSKLARLRSIIKYNLYG